MHEDWDSKGKNGPNDFTHIMAEKVKKGKLFFKCQMANNCHSRRNTICYLFSWISMAWLNCETTHLHCGISKF